ncbi:ankyrin repeat protein [Colletotrichum musicola]|uniref:Ankyrin repeat protein n=1 Tax=Colletotrichum musicola TaxID=2175873 RepID=A0A8H6MY78_9PEZI|nr:ankyrin repeat protein [Colletotrichum musicola]
MASVDCVNVLKRRFPVSQRQNKDFRTPLEALLCKTILKGIAAPRERLVIALIPNDAIFDGSEEISLWTSALHIFERVVSPNASEVCQRLLSILIGQKVHEIYESNYQRSALLPLAEKVTTNMVEVSEIVSPLEVACLPEVQIRDAVFEQLLTSADPSKTVQAGEDYGPIHFTAGFTKNGSASMNKLRRLLHSGFDCNEHLSARYGLPLAHHIAMGSLRTAVHLLEFGADPWSRGSYPFDAALMAVRCNHSLMLEKIAAINFLPAGWDQTWVAQDVKNRTISGNALHLAAMNGDVACLKFYLDQRLLTNLEVWNRTLQTPLHYAARYGHLSAIQFLHDRKGNIDAQNQAGQTPLDLAVLAQKYRAIDPLTNLGAKRNAYRPFVESKVFVLFAGYWTMEREFLSEPLKPCRHGHSHALEEAAAMTPCNTVLAEPTRRFFEEGGDILGEEKTPFQVAIDAGNIDAIRMMISVMKDIIQYASPETPPNITAGIREHRQSGLSVPSLTSILNREAQSSPYSTALHDAASRNQTEVVMTLAQHGSEIDKVDGNGSTALHISAMKGFGGIVKYLLGNGANPDLMDSQGWTPLMLASYHGRWELAQLLLESSKFPMMANLAGETVLHLMAMAEKDNDAVVPAQLCLLRKLMDRGGDLHLLDADGVSVAHLLMVRQNSAYLLYLLNLNSNAVQIHQLAVSSRYLFNYQIKRLLRFAWSLLRIRSSSGTRELERLIDCKVDGTHSLFCLAACSGQVEAMSRFLALSSDILEHRCQKHGTALKAALFYGREEAVRCLIRHGAAIPHDLLVASTRDLSALGPVPFSNLLRWMLVGRHTERVMISNNEWQLGNKLRDWSGPVAAEVPLRWDLRKSRNESILEYAQRRQRFLLEFRGKVVKVVKLVERL